MLELDHLTPVSNQERHVLEENGIDILLTFSKRTRQSYAQAQATT